MDAMKRKRCVSRQAVDKFITLKGHTGAVFLESRKIEIKGIKRIPVILWAITRFPLPSPGFIGFPLIAGWHQEIRVWRTEDTRFTFYFLSGC